jgi:hypothetical protein
MPGTLSASPRHGATHRAHRCKLEASTLSSLASPLCPDKAAFLCCARAASSMGSGRGGGDGLDGWQPQRLGWPRWVGATEAGTTSTGVATEARTASTGGGLGARLGGLNRRPQLRP